MRNRGPNSTDWEVKAEGGGQGTVQLAPPHPHPTVAGHHLVHICVVEMELSLAQREKSQDANKALKGRTSENLGLSRVESVGRNLLKSDTLGKKPYVYRECGRDLVRSQILPGPCGHSQRGNQKSQFTGNR